MLSWQSRVIELGILAVLLAGISGVAQNGRADCRNPDYYSTASRLLRALYPELQHKGVTVQLGAFQPFEADGPPLVFNIWVSDVRPTEPIKALPSLSSAERVGHLSAHFEFRAPENQVELMFASGSFVNSDKSEALKNLVDKHAEWDERQMSDAIQAAGAKFGPAQREAISTRFPLKELEPILGNIEIQSVQFEFRGDDKPPSYAILHWNIHFRAHRSVDTNEYFVSMEPFDGKVVMLGRAFGNSKDN